MAYHSLGSSHHLFVWLLEVDALQDDLADGLATIYLCGYWNYPIQHPGAKMGLATICLCGCWKYVIA